MNTASSTSPFGRLAGFYCAVARLIGKLQPLLLLGFRLYVARVFLLSGLTKIHDWSITVALFTDEYHVPILPPAVAATPRSNLVFAVATFAAVTLTGHKKTPTVAASTATTSRPPSSPQPTKTTDQAVTATTGAPDPAIAHRQAAAIEAKATEKWRYDMTYLQCMYAKGNQIPVPGGIFEPTYVSPGSSPPGAAPAPTTAPGNEPAK